MIRFEYQYSAGDPKIIVELSPDSGIDDLLEQFRRFLLASGYVFSGEIVIVGEKNGKS